MAPIPKTAPDTVDDTIHDLDRLLKRLDSAVLSDNADTSLRHSPYQRKRIGGVSYVHAPLEATTDHIRT